MLITNVNKNKIICTSIPNFFEFNKPRASKINFDLATAEQKITGIPFVVYEYENEFHINVKKNIYGEPLIKKEVIINFFKNKFGNKFPFIVFNSINNSYKYCWLFSYIRQTRLTPHYNEDVVLIAGINKETNVEIGSVYVNEFARTARFTRPWSNKINSIEDAKKLMYESMLPFDEGMVIIDNKHNRVFLKNKNNIILRKLIEGDSSLKLSDVAELSKIGTDIIDLIIVYYPNLRDIFKISTNAIKEIITSTIIDWHKFGTIDTRKEFSNKVMESKGKSLLFGLYNNNVHDFYDAMRLMSVDSIVKEIKNNNSDFKLEKAYSKLIGET